MDRNMHTLLHEHTFKIEGACVHFFVHKITKSDMEKFISSSMNDAPHLVKRTRTCAYRFQQANRFPNQL